MVGVTVTFKDRLAQESMTLFAAGVVQFNRTTRTVTAKWAFVGPCAFDYLNSDLIKHVAWDGDVLTYQDTHPKFNQTDPAMKTVLLSVAKKSPVK
jgi:hypothetical protein